MYLIYGYMKDVFSSIVKNSSGLMILEVLRTTGVIFSVCLLVEKVRLWLVDVLKINWLVPIIEKKLDNILNIYVDIVSR